MSKRPPFLEIRFEGPSVGPGRIPLSCLIHFLPNMSRALRRSGRILHEGRPRKDIVSELDLNLTLLTHGSPAVVLGFDRPDSQGSLAEEILETGLRGLQTIQQDSTGGALPVGFDEVVLGAWRDAGVVFRQGIDKIDLTLEQKSAHTSFTEVGARRIEDLIRAKEPETNVRTIEGRLVMADFNESKTSCRIHPSFGDPVQCLFDEGQKESVLKNILQYVRVTGSGEEDPQTGRIRNIKIRDIIPIEDQENASSDSMLERIPFSQAFWESPTLEELAKMQGVKPISDVRILFGTWPGEEDDGFESEIDELRRSEREADNQA